MKHKAVSFDLSIRIGHKQLMQQSLENMTFDGITVSMNLMSESF